MPSGAVASPPWVSGSWLDTAWEENTWGLTESSELPDVLVTRTRGLTETRRTRGLTPVRRTRAIAGD